MLKLSGAARYRRMDEGTGWGALASGSFGKVYIAVDNHTDATVAVKRQDLPSDAAARELAFYMALRHNTHPNIMSLWTTSMLLSREIPICTWSLM